MKKAPVFRDLGLVLLVLAVESRGAVFVEHGDGLGQFVQGARELGFELLQLVGDGLAPGVFDLLLVALADPEAGAIVQRVAIVEVLEGVLRGPPTAEDGEGEGFKVKVLIGCPAQAAGAAAGAEVP